MQIYNLIHFCNTFIIIYLQSIQLVPIRILYEHQSCPAPEMEFICII